ncbi:MAG: MlaD family protein [Bacteroidota bacterium]|nr:MlaD family protein [Bacteroidota bacterium]
MNSELKIAIVGLLALLVLIWGVNFLKGNNLFVKSQAYYAIYDNIDGLESSSPVRINGLSVGNVSNIYFHPNNSGQIVVEFTLTEKIRFPKNSIAKIYNADIMGTKAMLLIFGSSSVMASQGDTLFSDV